MNDFKTQYLILCRDLNDCSTKEEVKKHNAAMKKLGQLFHDVKREQDRVFLLDLMNYRDDQVRSLVAAHCLGMNVYISEAKKVLHEIARNKTNPILAFEAQATLDVWKKQGYLNF